MDHYHPWRDLRRRDLTVLWRDHIPGDLHSATDGRKIVMRRGLTQTQRRCALAHELVHIDMGHHGHMPPMMERLVHQKAAQRLITWARLAHAAVWATNVHEWASALWVTPAILHARIDTLTRTDRTTLGQLITHAQDDHGGQHITDTRGALTWDARPCP